MSIKDEVRTLLRHFDRAGIVKRVNEDRRVVTALNRLLFDNDEVTRWRAAQALGWVAAEDPYVLEKVIGRFIYTMNDDSGSIGWMAPQALAEICVGDPDLVEDFFPIVISSLDNEVFTAGVLWAIGRVAPIRPDMVEGVGPRVARCLDNRSPEVRGQACLALTNMGYAAAEGRLRRLLEDSSVVSCYDVERGAMVRRTVGELAGEALASQTRG
jgi:HEAT repeat protein